MEKLGTGRAKLLLFGEHAAVYGFPAIGLGLAASTEVRVLEDSTKTWRFPGLPAADAMRFGAFLSSASAIFPGLASGGGEIRISSNIPRGLGFGSSAALCVALSLALADEGATSGETWSSAHRAEGFFHGHPSGIDTGLSLLGGLRSFHPRSPALPETGLLRGLPLHLVLGAVPRRDTTAALVGGLHGRMASGDRDAGKLVGDLGAIAGRAVDLIEGTCADDAASMARLGALLGEAHEALKCLGLGDHGIDRLIGAALGMGALGGKQSGAGSGGAFFLLYPSEASARASALELALLAQAEGIALAAPPWAFSSRPS